MRVELISIGDELLIGQTINTNAAWLGQQLTARGISVNRGVTVADTEGAIREAVKEGFERADVLILTGGLGPTKDDITKKTLASIFDVGMERHEETYQRVKSYIEGRNRPMLDVHAQQALVPVGTRVLTNTNGTAPGMWMEHDGKILISLPGVPYEMKGIMEEYGFPELEKRADVVNIYHKTILTQGVGESTIAARMEDWENEIRERGFGLAYLPSPGMVKIRLTSANGEEDEPVFDAYFRQLEAAFPRNVYGYGETTLGEVVGHLLRERGATISTAESCTGGALASQLVSVSGSSDYFQGSFVTYSNELKQRILSVDENLFTTVGAVSSEVVEQMADNARCLLATDYCLSVSGIAGPTGGTDEKPVGTVWIGLSTPDTVLSKKFLFGTNRERNIQLTVLTALNWLRCELLGIKEEKK